MEQLSTGILGQNVRKGLNFTWSTQAILFCAIIIACVGLNVDSPPIVIGAMLISPLMAPVVGIGYGVGNRDPKILARSTRLLLIQVTVAVVGATIYFFISPLNATSAQLLARTEPTLWDVLIAIVGGFAGVISSAKRMAATSSRRCNCDSFNATTMYSRLWNQPFKFDIYFGCRLSFLINVFFIALSTAIGTIFFRVRSGES